jgi:3-phosphoshikimate 1-carboxyvinyltransferase
MKIKIQQSTINNQQSIAISGSKSESNRLLLLKAFYPQIKIENLSISDDSVLMKKALEEESKIKDIHHAGTAMRFLTAYYSIQKGEEVTLTGSQRMKERPIHILVNALRELGASIIYLEKEGFPPLKIKGTTLLKNKVNIKANVSSQYISALLLLGSKLEEGLILTLEGEITSLPYIKMTLELLTEIGIKNTFNDNVIKVFPNNLEINETVIKVESDWSSASYFFSIAALSNIGTEIKLTSFNKNSKQGDSVLMDIFKLFGVSSEITENTLSITKTSDSETFISLDLVNTPDLAQTIAVTALGLGIECKLIGLHTLKIKETDRLVALKTEIEKLGGKVNITNNSLHIHTMSEELKLTEIDTYNDHRMALAFAPLAIKTPIVINNADVVSKSYPHFWDDLKTIGFQISQ